MNKFVRAIAPLLVIAGLQFGCQSTGVATKQDLAASKPQSLEEIYEQFGKLPAIEAIGFVVDNIYSIPEEQWTVAKSDLEIDERLQVVQVLDNSIAHKAGVEPGDRLLQINGTYIPKTKDAVGFIRSEIAPRIDGHQPVTFLVIRGGTALQLSTSS